MAAVCIICGKEAVNTDIFFDTSISSDGVDRKNDRQDEIVCINDIASYIKMRDIKKINLIRRIELPGWAR